MKGGKTATIRINRDVIRELKKYLAPVDGKIKDFVEEAIKNQIEMNELGKKLAGKK